MKRSNKKLGARHTTNNKTAANDKSISSRNTKATKKKKNINATPTFVKSDAAKARLSLIQNVMATKTKFIAANEFTGSGKVLQFLDVYKAEDKYNPGQDVLQVKVLDAKTNQERLWNVSSARAIRAITPFIVQELPSKPVKVWTVGTKMDTQYYAKDFSDPTANFTEALQQNGGGETTITNNIPIGKRSTATKKIKKKKVKAASKKKPLKKTAKKGKVSKRKTE